MKQLKKTMFGMLMLSFLVMTGCSSVIKPMDAPCDNFGQHCEPKVPINQWRAS